MWFRRAGNLRESLYLLKTRCLTLSSPGMSTSSTGVCEQFTTQLPETEEVRACLVVGGVGSFVLLDGYLRLSELAVDQLQQRGEFRRRGRKEGGYPHEEECLPRVAEAQQTHVLASAPSPSTQQPQQRCGTGSFARSAALATSPHPDTAGER